MPTQPLCDAQHGRCSAVNYSCLALQVKLHPFPDKERKSLWVPSGWECEARASLLPSEPSTNRIYVNKTMLNQTYHYQTASLSKEELKLCSILTSFSTAILNFNLPAVINLRVLSSSVVWASFVSCAVWTQLGGVSVISVGMKAGCKSWISPSPCDSLRLLWAQGRGVVSVHQAAEPWEPKDTSLVSVTCITVNVL